MSLPVCVRKDLVRKQVGNVQVYQKSNISSIAADQGEPIDFRYLWQELVIFLIYDLDFCIE